MWMDYTIVLDYIVEVVLLRCFDFWSVSVAPYILTTRAMRYKQKIFLFKTILKKTTVVNHFFTLQTFGTSFSLEIKKSKSILL